MDAKQGVVVAFTLEEIEAFWDFQNNLYNSLGPAADDVIDLCGDGEELDSFFEKLRKSVDD